MAIDEPDFRRSTSVDSVERAAEAVRRFSRSLWLDLTRRDQSERWRGGTRVTAESYFDLLPELRQDHEDALVLVCGEVRCRCEAGEPVALAEYVERFPDLADGLAIQFELDGTLGNLTGGVEVPSAPEPKEFRVPGFELLKEIGRGASGRVFLAKQFSVDRLVAIKVIQAAHTDLRQLNRHRQEASILSKMKHPHVVQIYDTIETDGMLYSVIEYVDGPTLAEFSAGQPQPPHAAAELVRTLAQAIHAVHEAGILHRDLKPSNVLLTSRGEPKITDFGLAKVLSNASLVTTQQCLLGTPSYMSPEQAAADGSAAVKVSDVYSLGAILYELLTGRPPFLGVTILDTLTMIREREPTAPHTTQPHTPRDLETICLKCLAKAPLARYQTAAELADDLGRFLVGVPILARRPSWRERAARWCRRNPLVAALSACLLVTGTIGFFGVVWQWREAEYSRREADRRARDASEGVARLKLANGFLERGHGDILDRRWDDAYTAFTRAIELRPDHVHVWEARGEYLYVRLGLWDLAAKDLSRAFELQPPNFAHRWWWNALLRIHEGDMAGYRDVCRRLRERKGQNGAAAYAYFLVRSLCLAPENRPIGQDMVDLANELAICNPNQSAYSHLQGVALLRAGAPQQAVDRCRESLKADPRGFCRELNYPILALAHAELGQTNEARTALAQSTEAMSQWMRHRCEIGPDPWVANFGASGIWPISSWDWLECEVYTREARLALGLGPTEEDPRAKLLRARAFASLRRFDAADEEFKAASAKVPHDATVRLEAHRARAYLLAQRQECGPAALEFAEVSRLSPDDCRPLEFRALMHLAANEVDAYRATCAELMRRFGNTQNHAIANTVVDACVLRPNALSDMSQLVRVGEVAKTSYFGSIRLLGAAHFRAGHYEQANGFFQDAAKISPLKPCDLAFYAMSLYRLGHAENARLLLASAERWIEEANHPDANDLTAEGPAWGGWYEKVQVPILIDEARTMIEPGIAVTTHE